LKRFNMSLGTGRKVRGKVFRIGHLGEINGLALAGTAASMRRYAIGNVGRAERQRIG
jgi:alanine-glyoxylate transaminase / serine-glyoxylate transaminase / serine-pyruvate transaminase